MPPRHHVNVDERGLNFARIAPGQKMTAVTPSDSQDNCPEGSTLYVGTGGILQTLPEGNEDTDIVAITVVDGTFIDQVTFRRIFATNTTADDIYAIHSN
jgi:hypothetical protein